MTKTKRHPRTQPEDNFVRWARIQMAWGFGLALIAFAPFPISIAFAHHGRHSVSRIATITNYGLNATLILSMLYAVLLLVVGIQWMNEESELAEENVKVDASAR